MEWCMLRTGVSNCCRLLIVFAALFTAFSGMIASCAFAAPAVGKFAAIEGRVDVLREGALPAVVVKPGDAVYVKDIVRTKSDSKAEIIFDDGIILRISQRSRLDISEYSAGTKGVLKLPRGKIEAVVPKKTATPASTPPDANRFEVRTPNAVAGARVTGTGFFVFYRRSVSRVAVKKGEVFTNNLKFSKDVVIVGAGMMTTIMPDKPPSESKPFSDEDMKGH